MGVGGVPRIRECRTEGGGMLGPPAEDEQARDTCPHLHQDGAYLQQCTEAHQCGSVFGGACAIPRARALSV
jgi:hypothetical protein